MIETLLSDPALARVWDALPGARVVGGAVRDALLGLAVSDIDLATPDAPDAALQALDKAGLRVIPTGLSHGTVTALVGGRPFEITTLRRDVATDGRHAEVVWTEDWRQDAARRDFTINAMSLGRDGKVHDYFGGTEDLAAGRVRFVGDPATRIAEDYLRILRYFRFVARFGSAAPETGALAAIQAGIPGLARLSAERVWSELKRILGAPDPAAAVRRMHELGVLRAVLPEATNVRGLDHLAAAGAPSDALLRLAAMAQGHATGLVERLRLSNEEATRLAALLAGPVPTPQDSDAALRRLLAEEEGEILADRTFLQGGAGSPWNDLRARVRAMTRPVFPLEGRDALALGARPGPRVGEALRRTRKTWIEQGCTEGADALRGELARQLAAVDFTGT